MNTTSNGGKAKLIQGRQEPRLPASRPVPRRDYPVARPFGAKEEGRPLTLKTTSGVL